MFLIRHCKAFSIYHQYYYVFKTSKAMETSVKFKSTANEDTEQGYSLEF